MNDKLNDKLIKKIENLTELEIMGLGIIVSILSFMCSVVFIAYVIKWIFF